jgi:phospholipid-binding lipoprotein MlaA
MKSSGQSLRVVALAALLAASGAVWGEASDSAAPLDGFNMTMFRVNEALDKTVAKPIASGYQAVVPSRAQLGVGNFFSNIGELQNVLNDLLQGKFGQALNDGGRFLINSTVGVAGLFDVAARMGLEESDGEDFGQTLAVWGVPEGPYLVLPLFGPSTLRDAPSGLVDRFVGLSYHLDDVAARNALLGLSLIDTRAGLLGADAAFSGDRYILFKEVYLQRRDYLINDGVIEDDFGDFGDFDEF